MSIVTQSDVVVPSMVLSVDTLSALRVAAETGEVSIDKWRQAADKLFADGVRVAMITESHADFNSQVFKDVRSGIIEGMKGERTKYLLSVESKQLSSGDDKDLRKMAENRLKEHMRSVRKYLKSHEEGDKKGVIERLLMSDKLIGLLQEGLEYLHKDQPEKLKNVDIAACIVALRDAKAKISASIIR